MYTENIKMEDSRTVETTGYMGKTIFSKCIFGLHSVLSKEDDYEECKNIIKKRIDDHLDQRQKEIEERANKFKAGVNKKPAPSL